MNKDIVIVDHITRLSYTEVNPKIIEDFTFTIKNVRIKNKKII